MRLPGFERKQDEPRGDPKRGEIRPTSNDDWSPTFIVITPDEAFHATLQQIAEARHWQMGRVASVDDVEALIRRKPTPMVVYDWDSAGDNWRNAVKRLSQLPGHPCVLLASHVADNYLLDEVVRNHGYDILPKSVTRERLIQGLQFAWSWACTREQSGR